MKKLKNTHNIKRVFIHKIGLFSFKKASVRFMTWKAKFSTIMKENILRSFLHVKHNLNHNLSTKTDFTFIMGKS